MNNPSYAQNVDAAITSLGVSESSAPNGHTVFYPNHTTLRLMESPPSDYSSRVLLQFGSLHTYLPPTTTILASAELVLTFTNSRTEGAAQGEGFFLTGAWKGTLDDAGDGAKSLGWLYRLPPATSNGKPMKWKPAGGWPTTKKVVPPNFFTFDVPAGGRATVSIQLPVAKVKGWLASNGKKNFGVMVRLSASTPGFVDLRSSHSGEAGDRPMLRLTYKTK